MYRIIVSIALSDSGIDTIKSTPELSKKEMEYVNLWKTEGILESFYISVTKKEAVLIFKEIDEAKCKEMIEILPYFPYMSKIEYLGVDKQF
jgi:hypothetical protein